MAGRSAGGGTAGSYFSASNPAGAISSPLTSITTKTDNPSPISTCRRKTPASTAPAGRRRGGREPRRPGRILRRDRPARGRSTQRDRPREDLRRGDGHRSRHVPPPSRELADDDGRSSAGRQGAHGALAAGARRLAANARADATGPREHLHEGDDLAQLEGFLHVRGDPALAELVVAFLARHSGLEEHRDVSRPLVPTEPIVELETGHPRQTHIYDQDVGSDVLRGLERGRRIGHQDRAEPRLVTDRPGEQLADRSIVLHDKHHAPRLLLPHEWQRSTCGAS